MTMASFFRQTPRLLGGLALLAGTVALPAVAHAQATQPENCHAYKVDEEKNRILFNKPDIYVIMPPKVERERLRAQGTPGQIFHMKNCDVPDFTAQVDVHKRPGDSDSKPAEKVPCAVRVVILSEKDNWVQVKGHTSLWKGTGWIQLKDNIVVVKY